jgi:hypothetical protein
VTAGLHQMLMWCHLLILIYFLLHSIGQAFFHVASGHLASEENIPTFRETWVLLLCLQELAFRPYLD